MPIIKKTDKWVARNFRLSEDDLKPALRSPEGMLYIQLVVDTNVLDIQKDLEAIKIRLGMSRTNIHTTGKELCGHLQNLMNGRLATFATAKRESDAYRLCELLSQISATDFQALRQFWGLRYTPVQIEQALTGYSKRFEDAMPEHFFLALHNLAYIGRYPSAKIPDSV